MQQDLRKVCLFVGATGTLGTMFCRMFARTYNIAGVWRSKPPVSLSDGARNASPSTEDTIFYVHADLEQPGDIERAVDLTVARFGGVNLLVNSAMRFVQSPLLGGRGVVDAMHDQIITNTILPLQVATALMDRCWSGQVAQNRARGRNIVNVSSTSGVFVYPGCGQAGYSVSKAALNILTYHMASEFAPVGIRVNAIAPTSFPSIVSTESVANLIARINSDTGTGDVIVLDQNGERSLSVPIA